MVVKCLIFNIDIDVCVLLLILSYKMYKNTYINAKHEFLPEVFNNIKSWPTSNDKFGRFSNEIDQVANYTGFDESAKPFVTGGGSALLGHFSI